MASKAPPIYDCPCCGSKFVNRRSKRCRGCDIPLHLEGEYIVQPCYLYLRKEKKWFWFESGLKKPWEDGWKRRPKHLKSSYFPWLEQYPGRPTGLPEHKAETGPMSNEENG